MNKLFDFSWYAPRLLKIQTKTEGLCRFRLMQYQKEYVEHLKTHQGGIVRSVVLKARQCGFSTLVGGLNIHRAVTTRNYKSIVLADKSSRTDDVINIYKRFIDHLDPKLKPMIAKNNEREIVFDNPNDSMRVTMPGLGSSITAETALDPNAGRAGTRAAAHLTECAFYRYPSEIDEGIQNSIPLAKGTFVVKESTANGMSGLGESFYHLWNAAERGESIFRPFFVAWFKVDNYAVEPPRGFIPTEAEKDILKRCPEVTLANLAWRRLKIDEYAASVNSTFTPAERFCQDFPSYPEEAFLHSGLPVFDVLKLRASIQELKSKPPEKKKIKVTQPFLSQYQSLLTVYEVPKEGKKYSIGIDVSEGLEIGDASSLIVIDEDLNECATIHGKIDPDHLGHIAVEMAKIYNKAILVPEINNMGYATLTAIKNDNYFRIYSRAEFDKLEDEKLTDKLGWKTTMQSKQTMLSRLVAAYRDDEIKILSVNLLREMLELTRESTGDVVLNGRDRTVACCLAVMGLTQLYERARVVDHDKREVIQLETRDLYRDKVHFKKGRE